ncbi:LysR family transcriptional regulator [Azorhizobium sp. AG788]|uniref:LysR family transcriptional regulator n=1 Tax=Azorhizobium sp. AG788 TaxID=2183897 RepID=UPI0031391693
MGRRRDEPDGAPEPPVAARADGPAKDRAPASARLHPGQLDVFSAVVATGSVTAASRHLNLSQPAVSRRLAELERSVGFALFLRDGKRLIITPEGAAFHDELMVSYAGLERMTKVAGEIREVRRGHVRFAAIPALCFGPVPRALAEFMRLYPDINVTFEVHASARIRDAVANGLFDVGVTQAPERFAGLTIAHSFQAPCRAVLPPGHRLASRPALGLEDLPGQGFIAVPPDSEVGRDLRHRLEAAGLALNVRAEALTSLAACALVAAGAGISVVDPFTAEEFGGGQLAARPFLPRLDFRFAIALPERRIASQPVTLLVALLARHLAQDPRIER